MKKSILLYLFVVCLAPSLFGQQDIRNCIDAIYGTDDLLINGTPYNPAHPRANGDPYFNVNEYLDGKVFIQDKVFEGLHLKYEVDQQFLVLKTTFQQDVPIVIELNNTLVDSFIILNQKFISTQIIPEIDLIGFVQLIHHGKSTLYYYQTKNFVTEYTERNPRGKYSLLQSQYYLVYKGKSYKIVSNKDFLKVFGHQNVRVKSYMKENNYKWGKMDKEQLQDLLNFCDEI